MDDTASGSGLARLTDALRGLPPVRDWNPSVCGEIDIVILRDGRWTHEGAPIARAPLVRLFSTILRREADGYWLVTPVEKLKIVVEDAPFVAVAVEAGETDLTFTTNVGDVVTADAAHRILLRCGEGDSVKPYVEVRDGLEALIARPVYYELAAMAQERQGVAGVTSSGVFFPLDMAS